MEYDLKRDMYTEGGKSQMSIPAFLWEDCVVCMLTGDNGEEICILESTMQQKWRHWLKPHTGPEKEHGHVLKCLTGSLTMSCSKFRTHKVGCSSSHTAGFYLLTRMNTKWILIYAGSTNFHGKTYTHTHTHSNTHIRTQAPNHPRQSHMDSLGDGLSPPVHWKTQWISFDADNGQELHRE